MRVADMDISSAMLFEYVNYVQLALVGNTYLAVLLFVHVIQGPVRRDLSPFLVGLGHRQCVQLHLIAARYGLLVGYPALLPEANHDPARLQSLVRSSLCCI